MNIADYDFISSVISVGGANSKDGSGSTFELVLVPTLLVNFPSKFQLKKIMEPYYS